jgi:trk system potassium uptake protein
MKIVIAGAGEVGFHLAKMLSTEAQDIYLIDQDAERLRYADNHIDVITHKGDATSIKVLEDVNIKNADLIIAVTSHQEANLIAAILGKKLGAKRAIARVKNYEYLSKKNKIDFEELGIDALFSARELASKEIVRLIKQSALTDNFDFGGGKLSLIGITLDSRCALINNSISSTQYLNVDMDFMPVAILRDNKTIIPRGTTILKKGDHVYFLTVPEKIDYILKITGKENADIKNIMILGGSIMGELAAEMLQDKYDVKLVEHDKNRCLELIERLPNTLIVNADGRNVETLEEEDLSDMDAFIAVTGNSETNIISCLVAKNHGVKKTIASVENVDYINLSQSIGVDTLINKKLIAVNNIFRYIRQGEVENIATLHGVDAEIIEFTILPKTLITKKPIKDLKFPKNAIIGGVIRGNDVFIPNGDFQIKENDQVVVVAFEEAIHDIEEFFK